jgi:rubredoxin
MKHCSCAERRNALCHPYYPCSKCGLDYDDETFYHVRKIRAGATHALHSRHRRHDTICIGCRQEERQLAKGPAPVIDWSAIEFGRFMNAARRTVAHHAPRYGRSVHDFAKAGWLLPVMAERMAKTPRCEYCHRPFHSIDDQTVDIVVPKMSLSWELNTKIACATCNSGKQRFEKYANAQELIDRWTQNWRRWLYHVEHCRIAPLKIVGSGERLPLYFDDKGLGSFLPPMAS